METVVLRHDEIERDRVGPQLAVTFHAFLTVGRFADDRPAAAVAVSLMISRMMRASSTTRSVPGMFLFRLS